MTLVELLSDGARHAPEFGGGLSNHLPMALLALQRLGADDTHLTAWHAPLCGPAGSRAGRAGLAGG
jgi:hypothetical protein